MNSFQEKFDKVKNPEKYLSPSQIKEGDKLAKKLSYFKAIFMLGCQIIIGLYTLGTIPIFGTGFLALFIFFSYKNYKRELKFIEKEFSE
jgi:hypothetical protein